MIQEQNNRKPIIPIPQEPQLLANQAQKDLHLKMMCQLGLPLLHKIQKNSFNTPSVGFLAKNCKDSDNVSSVSTHDSESDGKQSDFCQAKSSCYFFDALFPHQEEYQSQRGLPLRHLVPS